MKNLITGILILVAISIVVAILSLAYLIWPILAGIAIIVFVCWAIGAFTHNHKTVKKVVVDKAMNGYARAKVEYKKYRERSKTDDPYTEL